jgi:hypothetical protein
MLPCCSKRAGERIARPRGPLEIPRTQPDALWLQEDTVTAALDVERPTVRAVLARIGHDGIGGRFGVATRAGLVERLPSTGKPLFQAAERLIVDRDRAALRG